ncbi:hypothetical protein [Microcoleus sp. F4-D5]|uniref:hypothetical protein n=1 Tax=Microcoleus sp. F4-D5 TaxID=2818760 RepID=UPI002FD06E55
MLNSHLQPIRPPGKKVFSLLLYKKLLNGWGTGDRQHPPSNLQLSQVALRSAIANLKILVRSYWRLTTST